MKTSTITDGAHPGSGVSHGYVLNEKNKFEELDYGEEPTFAAAGNGGVWSSVEELWLYEKAIQKNLFLSTEWIDKSRTVYPFSGMERCNAFAVWVKLVSYKRSGIEYDRAYRFTRWIYQRLCMASGEKDILCAACNFPKPIKEIRTKLFELLQQNNLWLKR